MTTQKHTPGPWVARPMYYRGHGNSKTWFIRGQNDAPLHSAGGDSGSTFSPEPYQGHGFTQADAALIAAAPELLEALKMALVRLEDLAIAAPELERETDGHAATIRAAIARAEGR